MQKICVADNPFLLIDDGHLHIRIKKGDIIPLILNKAQRHIQSYVKKLWDEGKPVRLIVLKARQVGSTTDFMAIIYAVVSQSEGQGAAVIADEKGKANEIFDMAKLFQERCPTYLRPEIKKSNERKLEFEGIHSQIMIDTAENKDAGRSATIRFVLLSEYAYYRKANADAIMLGISHSVPSLKETMIIKETTANGFNHFKDEWDAAIAGENDYVAIFIPWYWDEGYMMKADENFIVGDPALGEISEDEPDLHKQMEKEEIDSVNERLQWRRWDIKNSCKGNVDSFKQENPSTPEEAFLASGQCFFDQKKLVRQQKLASEPLFRANIVKENYKFVLRKCDDGDYSFYKEPSKTGQYCIGGDACSGSGEDYACLVARDKSTNDIVAVYRAKCDPDELAFRAMMLGSLLNNAKIAIENDKFGFAANAKLITIYGNVYVQRTFNKIANKMVERFGWDTTAITRPLMLSQMQEEIREDSLQLKDKRLIKECLTFIKNPMTGKAEAEPGNNDDTVISCAISGQLRQEEPFKVKPERPSGSEITKENRNAGMRFSRSK